jgi:hypothetical protein
VKNQANGMAFATPDATDAMTHRHLSCPAALIHCRSLVHREYDCIALPQRDHIRSLASRRVLCHDEFATFEIRAGFGQQYRNLKRKNVHPIEVLVQTVVVPCAVREDQRSRSRLAREMALFEKRA